MTASETRFETLAIGDEILTGKIADTNSTFVSDRLFSLGHRVFRQTVVLDDILDIQTAIREAAARAAFVVCFGGLGPTSDDKTAEAVAAILGGGLEEHAEAKARLVKRFTDLGREVTPSALKQILYPAKAHPILNLKGLAPGFAAQVGQCHFYFLPGVPHEMKAMFVDSVLPDIGKKLGQTEGLHSHVWRLLNIPESQLQTVMDPVEAALPAGAWLGYRARYPENHLTLYWKDSAGSAEAFSETVARIRLATKAWAYTEGTYELEDLVLERLKARRWKVALAESCTGGLATQRLTRIAGASDSVWGGFTTYQVDAKRVMLGVVLDSEGQAVSALCSRRLAESTLRVSGCDIAGAVTGYMGPGGGTPENPVGTIYVCTLTRQGKLREKRISLIARERHHAQWGASTHLLHGLKESLEEGE